MAKKKRRYYFSYVRNSETIEKGYMSVDAYNDSDAHDQALQGLFTEFLCESREYATNNWEFTPVESPTDGKTN